MDKEWEQMQSVGKEIIYDEWTPPGTLVKRIKELEGGGSNAERLITFCPECGRNVPIDEDGCCRTCGGSAEGVGVRRLAIDLSRDARRIKELEAHVKRLESDIADQAESCKDLEANNAALRDAGGRAIA